MIDLTQFFQALISLAAAMITAVLVPWIKQKYSEEKINQIKAWARAAAAAAEKLYEGSGRGAEKLGYVLDFLENKGFGIDRDSLEKIVEAELYGLGLL